MNNQPVSEPVSQIIKILDELQPQGQYLDQASEVIETAPKRARRPMVNPRFLHAAYKRIPSTKIGGGKYYQPFLGKRTRMAFLRASEAERYADRCKARWIRLYDAAIVAQAQVAA